MKFEAEVTALSEQGMGVVKGPDEKTYFIRGTWPLDRGIFSVTEPPADEKTRYGFGELTTLLTPSPERVQPSCPHLGTGEQDCGGCPWMIADYSHQMRYKVHRVRHAFKRVSLDDGLVRDPWPSPLVFGYRARAQFKTNGKQIGYAGRQGQTIAPVNECLVLTEAMAGHLATLKTRLPKPEWAPREDFAFNYIDINEETDLSPENLRINKRQSFKQANTLQNERMKGWLRDSLTECPRDAGVLELFAGSGNLTQVISSLGFSDIIAVDVQSVAMAELRAQHLTGVNALARDLFAPGVMNRVIRDVNSRRPQVLIVNPPRDGLKHLVGLASLLRNLRTIFYISCNPVSCAFDLKKIVGMDEGWRITEIQPIDMMPHTPHIEILGRLDRG